MKAAVEACRGWSFVNTWTKAGGDGVQLCGYSVRHATGFVVDVLLWDGIVPQAMLYFNTPLCSDRGEAHTCEHLLLGKGNAGRWTAALEEASLATSTAWTGRLRTFYAFHTVASGLDVFGSVFAAKLVALLAPDATDEEIRREVCHVEVDATGACEEKGTVYAEMLASFRQPDFVLWHNLHRLIYGEGHPLGFEAGGTPDDIRTAEPCHLRRFHNANYHAKAGGAVVALPRAPASQLLPLLGEAINAAVVRPRPWLTPATGSAGAASSDAADASDAAGGSCVPSSQPEEAWLPPPRPAPPGDVVISRVPVSDASSGRLVCAWPGVVPSVSGPSAAVELSMLQLLVHLVAGGHTSTLHGILIASATRVLHVGTSVSGDVSSEPGRAVTVCLSGVAAGVTPEECAAVGAACRDAFASVTKLSGAHLESFNARARGQLASMSRRSVEFLAQPPQFGVRGVHDAWLSHLHDSRRCARPDRPHAVDLSFMAEAEAIGAMLAPNGGGGENANCWAPRIAGWGLADRLPVTAATRADAAFADEVDARRVARLARFAATHDVAAERAAAAAATAALAAASAATPLPAFTRSAPLEADAALDVDPARASLPGGGALLVARCPSLPGAHFGIALSMRHVPSALLWLLPALPVLMRRVPVTNRAGTVVPYPELCASVQAVASYLDATLGGERRSGRSELVLRCAGISSRDAASALTWLEATLCGCRLDDAESLPRLRDAVASAWADARAVVERRGEFYVDASAAAVLPNATPLWLLSHSHMARSHALMRTHWRLKAPPPEGAAADVSSALAWLAASAASEPDAPRFEAFLDRVASDGGTHGNGLPCVREALRDAARDGRILLPCLPAHHGQRCADWARLVRGMADDLLAPPGRVGRDARELLRSITTRDNCRAWVAAPPQHAVECAAAVRALVARLPASPVEPSQSRGRTRPDAPPPTEGFAMRRARMRDALHPCGSPPQPNLPSFVAVILPRAPQGGVVSMTGCATEAAAPCEDSLLDFLALNALAGSAPHSLFARGWAAGLAYSNGVSASSTDGRARYYADTCPDTARCVASASREAAADGGSPPVPWRAQYALAQCFTCRTGSASCEARAEAAACDCAEGRPPAATRAFRTALLRLAQRPHLAEELHGRTARIAAKLLNMRGGGAEGNAGGEGWDGTPSHNGVTLVLVGPDAQARGCEAAAGRAARRMYERDFWVADESDGNDGNDDELPRAAQLQALKEALRARCGRACLSAYAASANALDKPYAAMTVCVVFAACASLALAARHSMRRT